MTKKLIPLIACCAASITLGLRAEDSSTTPGSTAPDPSPGARSHSSYGGAQRLAHTETRGSKLMGADVKGTSGESLGKIEDVLLNPNSGRIDFAVLSLSGSGASASASSSSSTADAGKSASVSSSSGDKLVAIPWSLLHSAASGSGISASTEQASFTFSGESGKLQAAPSFGQNNWPDISQSSWRQSVYSHFGVSAYGGASATGASGSPGGVGEGASSTSQSSQDNSPATSPGSSSAPGSADGSASPKSTP